MNLWKLALEYFGLIAIIFAIAFLPLTKIATGAVLALTGAFFPSSVVPSDARRAANRAVFKLFGVNVTIAGSIRFSVISAGLIVLIIAAIEVGSTAIKTGTDVRAGAISKESLSFADFVFISALENDTLRASLVKPENIENNKDLYTIMWLVHCVGEKKNEAPLPRMGAALKNICEAIISHIDLDNINSAQNKMLGAFK